MRGSQFIRSDDKGVWTRRGRSCPQVREQVPPRPTDTSEKGMAAVPPRSKPGRCRGEWTPPTQSTWALVFATVWLTVSFPLSGDAWAAYGAAPGASPVGSPTVPPSSYEGGLVSTPNPLDSSGNLVITGNVGGAKQFRGPIPYGSTTSFGTPLGSTHLDSFLRYSAIPQGTGDYRPAPSYDAFYSPTATVSAIRPGQAGVSVPGSPRLASGLGQWRADQPPDVMDLGMTGQTRVPTTQMDSTPDIRWDAGRTGDNWPLVKTPEQIREIIAGERERQFVDSPTPRQDEQSAMPQDYQQQLEEFRRQLEKVKAEASQLEQSLTTGSNLPRELSQQPPQDAQAAELRAKIEGILSPAPTPDRLSDDSLQSFSPPLPDGSEFPKSSAASPADQVSPGPAYTSDASTRADRIAELFRPRVPGDTSQTQTDGLADMQRAHTFQTLPALRTDPAASLDRLGSTARTTSAPPDIGPDDAAEMQAQASTQPIAGQVQARYENLDPSTREKFDRHMKEARLYQQQGQYDRAAESFALASLYGAGEPRVYLGRSQALFAAGDYAGSALFLMKAVELGADQTLTKSDLVNLVGGPDLFIQRITDLEQRAQKADAAADLQFLLAYIYQQMDRPAEAKTAIAAAAKALPHCRAVALLQAAIRP